MQKALESAFVELLFGSPIDPADRPSVDAWLLRNRIPEAHAEVIREREIQRLVVYRRLIRGTLWDALEAAIPRSMARLGTLFDEYFDRFLAERGPTTHYLRDVTTEFLDYCQALWASDRRLPKYAYDLARHEALHIEIAAMPPRSGSAPVAGLELDAALEFSESSRLVRYDYAVHRLSERLDDRSVPDREPTRLFVYRSPEHEVRYLELTPLAASLVERLLAGASLRDALVVASRAEGLELDDSVLSGTAGLLADLSERGALIGPRAAERSSGSPEAIGFEFSPGALTPTQESQ